MTYGIDNVDPKKLGEIITALRKKFGDDPTEFLGNASAIWIIGAFCRLSDLGVISGGRIAPPDGIELWERIDEVRLILLPPNVVGIAIGAMVEQAVTEEIRDEVAKILAMYYTDSGRAAITRAGLECLYSTREENA